MYLAVISILFVEWKLEFTFASLLNDTGEIVLMQGPRNDAGQEKVVPLSQALMLIRF